MGVLAAGVTLSFAAIAAPTDRQSTYNQAQAALDRNDWSAAATGFAPLLPTDPHKRLGRSEAVIAARLGEALMHLGRKDEAQAWTARAVADLPNDPALIDTWLSAGNTARFSYDYDLAAKAYRAAVALAAGAKDNRTLMLARIGLAQAIMTTDPVAAAATLDETLGGDTGAMEPLALASIEALRARAAIIAGDRTAAQHWIGRALTHSGGLTENRVSGMQAEIRADAAVIARLSGDDEDARKYLAYTGAGRLEHMDWLGRYSGELPTCDPDGGPKPQDSVVVRFVITEDGRVEAAIPVYASRPGPTGALFAEAVSRWHWDPVDLKGANAFLRGTLRLELRCQSRPTPTALGQPFEVDTARWLEATHHIDAASRSALLAAPSYAGALVTSDDPLARALFGRPAEKGKTLSYAEAQHALELAGAPASAYALLAYSQTLHAQRGGGIRVAAGARATALSTLVPPLVQRFPRDKSSAWLELEWALDLESSGRFAPAQPLVAQVLSTPETVLPADDPIRRVAQLHAALIATRLGRAPAASAPPGLDAQQCSLFDTHPIPASVALSSEIFPRDAQRWGFEGHVEEDFDIGSDGRVRNVRTVLAYPPFVFGPGTEAAIRSFRYIPPAINGQAVGCDSQSVRINYRMPNG